MHGLEPAADKSRRHQNLHLATAFFDVISAFDWFQMIKDLLLQALRPFPRPNAA